ncbi:hypothetical protein [uncultured Polaribacter sp.]|uniref:hypothetical protein n=1 Tax=uncultured Polaribacter sp. TaxID=174711 RepID=UPI002627F130|nr:hypothetical protein [uncultured Polaribacter sp.]
MLKFYKTISIIFHPIVVPTAGIMLYFLLIPTPFNSNEKLRLLGLIFIFTYLIPLVILIFFKRLKLIKSFNAKTIKERKIPVLIMIVVFYLLGKNIINSYFLIDIGILFYATSIALVVVYLLFSLQIKTSLHLLSLGCFTGFFLLIGSIYNQQYYSIIIASLLLSGLLGNARLHLKAHTAIEVYLGYFIGFIAPFAVYHYL